MSSKYYLGVACNDSLMANPYLMKNAEPIEAKDFAEASAIFLSDPSVKRSKANDIVMMLSIRTGTQK